jgi:hypothetical protein
LIHWSPSDRVKHATLRGFLDDVAHCTLHAREDDSIKLFFTVPREERARKILREAEKFGTYGKSFVHTILLLLTGCTEL